MSIVWERFTWSSGADQYSFEIGDNGLFGTLRGSGRADVTLPIVAWEGMVESLKASRRMRSKASAGMPGRAGARWSDAETDKLISGFRSGMSLAELAAAHSRTVFAVEHQLERLRLIAPKHKPPRGR